MSSVEDKLPDGWVETTLNEVAQINPRESIKKGDIKTNIPMACIDSFSKKIYSFDKKTFKGGTKFRNGDTLLARITPCLENGKTAYVDILEEDEIGFGSTEYIVIREIDNKSDKQFLYYLSISPHFREVAIKAMTGTSGRQRVQTDVLVNKLFNLPPIQEQKAIAKVLTAFDDKIENLRAQNQTLEQTAQTIFKEWFGKYQVGDELPDGWHSIKIKDFDAIVTDYVANGSFASLAENVNYKQEPDYAKLIRLTDFNRDFNGDFVYVDKKAYEFLSKSKLERDDIIISNVGAYAGTVFKCPDLNYPMTLGPNAIVVKSNFNNFFYLLFTSRFGKHMLNSIITGSAQPKFNKTSFRNLELHLNLEYLEKFELMISVFMEKINSNKKQIQALTKTRDALLPKLMRGEIRVNGFKK
ncbi:restriction endonuclease subunit S [Cellulophaga omnivescoria]|uniref:restriction endonuclease subunit S n=1 Tax=Cellulophaga omnivescoria TaxID=1888890 RepID=UPI0022F04B10|nr:restriction endonuclease subunit S [Cellulophaga omnivescoria]WBU87966.1 restriction endonuclease subunit S [Cellulophaga omnivescoria]